MFWLRMVFSLLQFFFVCASVVSYVSHVAYVSSLFVSYLFFGASERTVLRDCDIFWVSSLIFFSLCDPT